MAGDRTAAGAADAPIVAEYLRHRTEPIAWCRTAAVDETAFLMHQLLRRLWIVTGPDPQRHHTSSHVRHASAASASLPVSWSHHRTTPTAARAPAVGAPCAARRSSTAVRTAFVRGPPRGVRAPGDGPRPRDVCSTVLYESSVNTLYQCRAVRTGDQHRGAVRSHHTIGPVSEGPTAVVEDDGSTPHAVTTTAVGGTAYQRRAQFRTVGADGTPSAQRIAMASYQGRASRLVPPSVVDEVRAKIEATAQHLLDPSSDALRRYAAITRVHPGDASVFRSVGLAARSGSPPCHRERAFQSLLSRRSGGGECLQKKKRSPTPATATTFIIASRNNRPRTLPI